MFKRPPKWLREMAKEMDTPEMRKLYLEQKRNNKNLDKMVDEFAKQNEDIFEHIKGPPNVKK